MSADTKFKSSSTAAALHALESLDDLAAIESKGGVLEALREARDQKIMRCMGISGHADPVAMKAALERHDFDCVQMALNLASARMSFGQDGAVATPMGDSSFEALALPVENRKGLGVVAMKIFGQERLVGKATTKELIYYSLSLPVSIATLGMPRPEMLEENVALGRAFQPLAPADMQRLRTAVPEPQRQAFARFMRDHRDA